MLRLQQLGFTNAFALLGGLSAWQSAKLPTDTAAPEAAPAPTQPATPTKPQ